MIDLYHNQILLNEAGSQLRELSALIRKELNPPAGPYGLFSHISQTLGRLTDCDFILRRLYKGREELNTLQLDKKLSPHDKYLTETNIDQYMQIDLESLYMFGGALLDQWAIISLYISGCKEPEKYKHPFHNIVCEFDSGTKNSISVIWDSCNKLMIWLDYHVRFCRNKFIVHSERPWQRGIFKSTYGPDYCLSFPSPPGWLDEKNIKLEIKEILHLLPEPFEVATFETSKRPLFSFVQPIFMIIDQISDRSDREKISRLFAKVGGSTPSFQITAEKLFTFILRGTELLRIITLKDINSVNIGRAREL